MRKTPLLLSLFAAFWAAALWAIFAIDTAPIDARPSQSDSIARQPQPSASSARAGSPAIPSAAIVRAEPRPMSSTAGQRPARPAVTSGDAAPIADSPTVPEAFPLDEWQWRDATAEDAWLEPELQAPITMETDPFDDPWGGEWSDQGGGS